MFNILSKYSFLFYLFERLFSWEAFPELSVQGWGIQKDSEALKNNHVCCSFGLFNSDEAENGWPWAAVLFFFKCIIVQSEISHIDQLRAVKKPQPSTIS